MTKHLSAAEACLLKIIQRIHFGRIEQLTIRNGQPVFDPPPRIVREVKLGADVVTRSPHQPKPQIGELFDALLKVGTGVVDIEIRHCLPFRLIITEGEKD